MTTTEIRAANSDVLVRRRQEILAHYNGDEAAELSLDRELWDIDEELERRRDEPPEEDTPALNPPWWEYR